VHALVVYFLFIHELTYTVLTPVNSTHCSAYQIEMMLFACWRVLCVFYHYFYNTALYAQTRPYLFVYLSAWHKATLSSGYAWCCCGKPKVVVTRHQVSQQLTASDLTALNF